MIHRARLHLTGWYVGIFIAMLLILGAAAFMLLRRSLAQEVDRGVETVVTTWLATGPRIERSHPLEIDREYEGATADVFLLVFRADGALISNPNGVEAEEFVEEGLLATALNGDRTWKTLDDEGVRVRVFAVPIRDDGRIEGVVIGGRSLAGYDHDLQLLLEVLGAVGVGGLLLAGAAGYIVAGRALAPIAVAYERQRAFVGDASHELRSPLAVMRAGSEILLRGDLTEAQRESATDIRDTSVEASQLVDDLLTLVRAESVASPAEREVTDVFPVVDEVIRQMQPLVDQHRGSIERQGADMAITFDGSDLRRVLRALIENVLAHTPEGTEINIVATVDGRHGLLTVRDSGPGVPDGAITTLFDAFTRVDSARTPTAGHSGLGLAIVRRLVARNDATVTARNLPGGGFEITIRAQRVR